MIDTLIEDSKHGISLMDSRAFDTAHFTEQEIRRAGTYILEHQDYTAYHVLMALQKHSPATFNAVPHNARAAVLGSALGHLRSFNDWDHLDNTSPSQKPAVHALLSSGEEAVQYLRPLLDDCSDAPFYGTEEATMSSIYHYRRCDFAYRYIMFLLNGTPVFHRTPEERDREIMALKRDLEMRENK